MKGICANCGINCHFDVSTTDMEAELQRRREEAAAAAEKERKAREVVVVCWNCDGKGAGTAKPYREEPAEPWTCHVCRGTGRAKALLATTTNAE